MCSGLLRDAEHLAAQLQTEFFPEPCTNLLSWLKCNLARSLAWHPTVSCRHSVRGEACTQVLVQGKVLHSHIPKQPVIPEIVLLWVILPSQFPSSWLSRVLPSWILWDCTWFSEDFARIVWDLIWSKIVAPGRGHQGHHKAHLWFNLVPSNTMAHSLGGTWHTLLRKDRAALEEQPSLQSEFLD